MILAKSYIESNFLDDKVRSRNLLKLYAEAEVRVDVGGEGEAGEVGAADSYRRS